MRLAYNALFSEQWPETDIDARVMLNNAFWHLRNVDVEGTIEARSIINRVSMLWDTPEEASK